MGSEEVTIEILAGWYYVVSTADGTVSRWHTLEEAKREYHILTGKEYSAPTV